MDLKIRLQNLSKKQKAYIGAFAVIVSLLMWAFISAGVITHNFNRSQLQKHIKMVKQGLEVDKNTIVIPFSAVSKQGRDEIYALIDKFLSAKEDNLSETVEEE